MTSELGRRIARRRYYQTSTADGLTFYGLFLNSLLNLGFSNIAEMGVVIDLKFIARRHSALRVCRAVASGIGQSTGAVVGSRARGARACVEVARCSCE